MKGQFYSIIAIVIAIPIFFFISGTLLSVQETKYNVIEKIGADQLSSITKNIEDDFHNGVEISLKRAILAATDYVITNGTYLPSAVGAILELQTNGTLFGQEKYLLINNTISDWKDKILNVSSAFVVNLTYSDPDGGQDATEFVGYYSITLTIHDRLNRWTVERTNILKSFSFSVEGFEDPVFPLNTEGLVRRQYAIYHYPITAMKFAGNIANANATGNVTFNESLPAGERPNWILVTNNTVVPSGWKCVIGPAAFNEQLHACYVKLPVVNPITTINNTIAPLNYSEVYVDNNTASVWSLPVKEALRHGLYIQGVLPGPDILRRLEGNITVFSNVSFFSFINTDEYKKFGLPVDDTLSRVDWVYWTGNSSNARTYRGFNDITWFRLDSATDDYLNLSELRN